MTPRSSASAKPTDGRGANSSFSISPQTRSAGRSSRGIDRHSARVSIVELEVESRGELDGAQHAQAVVGERRRIDDAKASVARSSRPSNGSMYSSVERIPRDRVDREVATARGFGDRHGRDRQSRRSRGVRGRTSTRGGAARRRCRRSCRPESSRRPLRRARVVREASGGDRLARPKTSMSMSFESRPSSRSRTHPPTISARPPAWLTARATSSVRSSVGDSLVIGNSVATAGRSPYLIMGPRTAVAAPNWVALS